MNRVYLSHNSIVSALGFNSPEVVRKIAQEISGISLQNDKELFPEPFYASVVSSEKLEEEFLKLNPKKAYTRLEKMMLLALQPVIETSNVQMDEKVGLIISTTKGNIDVLENKSPFSKERAYLSALGKEIQDFFGFKTEPILLSNACVSGVLAIAVAKRLIQQGIFSDVFIVAGDIVTQFTLSGFSSFQAMSSQPCKPYSKDRDGITLGELSASVLITSNKENLCKEAICVLGDASCNDANHISGPSRTGEGLYRSVSGALQEACLSTRDIDFISAHGTATLFNDEMEAVAFNRLSMQDTPLHSLKGYLGHTLGASGLVETIIGMHSLAQNMLYTSLGLGSMGVSLPLNVITKPEYKNIKTFLKTASGFGGCNTAVIFQKAISC
ncbi:MAG: beta-ketoacyl synthase N-terminal-like domain-containing protein [Flavobacteriaceae bacterium]|nr:beta-ketoacyl synthase [Flavobacteriaceae bacterium]